MKKLNLGLALIALFSILLIVYFNPLSVAQKATDVDIKVESEIYNQLTEDDEVTVIVKLRNNFLTDDITRIQKESKSNILAVSEQMKGESKFEIIYEYDAFNSFAANVDSKTLEALKNNNLVESIHEDIIAEIQLQQSLPLINATHAWTVPATPGPRLTGVGQTICILDSGVDYTHPALGGVYGTKVMGGYDFINNDSDPMDDNGHGTHVAGIAAANGMINSTSWLKGVAPDAKIIAEKVCNATGSCPASAMLAGMNHCFTIASPRKVSVITMSIGDGSSHSSQTTCPTVLNAAINTAIANGVPVVASSGNQGHKNGISWPSCAPNVISVGMSYDANNPLGVLWPNVCNDNGAMAQVDKIACASNSGPNLDLVAPGAKITTAATSTFNSCPIVAQNPLLAVCSGTSMAAPHVAGAIALTKQKYRNQLQTSTGVTRIEYMLKRSTKMITDPLTSPSLTFPRLSVHYLL